ncbi:DUF6123 family protein [Radiobacillus sp. PE A8.2]|uniref:DUF6123 family protein n=1 Tax=Radiobacillus sp. PE A8.2 TaxID=3380349 RepID=UPI00388EBA6D
MDNSNQLAYYIEDLWSRGFKLSDEDVHFIYFGKNSTRAPEWKIILSLQVTLRYQRAFDGSFFLSVLELLEKDFVKNRRQADSVLKRKGFA